MNGVFILVYPGLDEEEEKEKYQTVYKFKQRVPKDVVCLLYLVVILHSTLLIVIVVIVIMIGQLVVAS